MEEDLDVEGPYPFRRKSHVRYREVSLGSLYE